jgi:hypothetical protein
MSSEPTNGIRDCANFPRLVWVVPVILLVGGTSPLPDGYHTFTRMVTCGVAAAIALSGFRDRPVSQWAVPFALVAVLFNPFIPIHLPRQTWVYLDLGAAAMFAAHLVFVRCAPYTLRARRVFRRLMNLGALLALLALVAAMGYALLVLLGCAVEMTKPELLTIREVQFLPWAIGGGFFVVFGSGVLIYYLLKIVQKISQRPGEGKAA